MSRQNLIKKAQTALPAKSPADVKDFVEVFYAKVPPEDIELMGTEMLADTAKRHWKMSHTRKPGEMHMDIYNTAAVKEEGHIGRTIVDIVVDDMAFLVDSVAACITHKYNLIDLLVHPILHVERDGKGQVKAIHSEQGHNTQAESHIHVELHGLLAEDQLTELGADLSTILTDIDIATGDWLPMRDKLHECQQNLEKSGAGKYSDEEFKENLSFLEYLYKDNFTLLGYREYKFSEGADGKLKSKAVKESSLGLLREQEGTDYIDDSQAALPLAAKSKEAALAPVLISKINKLSTVHRPVPLDAVSIMQYDKNGKVTGKVMFIGLFTSVTYSRSIQDIPLLRRKAAEVTQKSGFRPGSHDYKALRHILEKYPRDELFQTEMRDLLKNTLSILRLQERQRIALYMRRDPFGNHVSCLVYVPRERYDTRLRKMFARIIEEELGGTLNNYYSTLDDSPFARVMYLIRTPEGAAKQFDAEAIEAKLIEAGRMWGEKLADALLSSIPDEDIVRSLAMRYGWAFPIGYRERYLPKQAVYDIGKVEEALTFNEIALDLYQSKECGPDEVRLKVFHPDRPVILSDIMPILENMGLQIVSELPFQVKPEAMKGEKQRVVWIQDFLMKFRHTSKEFSLEAIKALFEEALGLVWRKHAENDSLNALVIGAQMSWRDIMILRSYVRYMRQMNYPLGIPYIERTLTQQSEIAGHLVDLFKARLDPARQKKAEADAMRLATSIDTALQKVDALDDDRIIRTLNNLIDTTLRTNFFQMAEDGRPKTYVSIKMDSSAVKGLPEPRPYREIFVYSPRMEGIHLRADVIARGGIRWSDRHEDFRTEVLSLMKAQQVKNSVIVPMGAKGGFIVKNPPADRKQMQAEGIECYKILVRGLLDITDNRVGTKIVPPKDVVRRDGDDPYLVVAADKGTATFSNIANALSLEYKFWLGDAFASGGSAGYDHKIMGITAKGAWESVKRHFRELNHDIQTKPFDVVGVGDMGGDVFGNGMLLSQEIRLIGAFNHMHIFCDPDPDTKKTFAERQRLFDAVKGWDGYDQSLLSKGGKIFLRSEKNLKLTPQIMKSFEIDRENVTPAELIQAMLRAKTDLLWFGGIGTYVKASTESHADAGDKGNDTLRINANEIRASVLGEGANLAVTQKARIEYAQQGGKLNADFIDNSGGVDSSDHEVNIKILMTAIMSQKDGDMTVEKRNKLLASMTDEVADLVLRNNYQQAQAISLAEFKAMDTVDEQAKLIVELEKKAGLNRKLENLPKNEEMMARRAAGKGLTRPELAILQAYSKIWFSKELLATDIPDSQTMQEYWLVDYFPVPLRKKYHDEIMQHRLRREIVATTMSTSLVNRMGPTFVTSQMNKTGTDWAAVTRAYLVARDSFRLRELWDQIEALDNKVPAQVQMQAMADIAEMMERETTWFLTRIGRPLDIEKDIEYFRSGIDRLRAEIESVVTKDQLGEIIARINAGMKEGLPKALAREIALIPTLASACDIIRIAKERNADLIVTARTYFELGEYFQLDWLRGQALALAVNDRWSQEALDGLVEQLHTSQAGLTVRILRDMEKALKAPAKGKKPASISVVRQWIESYETQAAHLEPFFAEIRKTGTVDLPLLIIAEQRLRHLYGG